MTPPCIQDEGLYSEIPDVRLRMTTFVESYYRVGGDLDVLRAGLHLDPACFYAAMAFYHANKELFDTEYQRIMEVRRVYFEELIAKQENKQGWAELKGAWRGNETDEEVEAALERLS